MFFHFVEMKLLDKSFGIYFVKVKAENGENETMNMKQLYN